MRILTLYEANAATWWRRSVKRIQNFDQKSVWM